jgi:hypothetical protein
MQKWEYKVVSGWQAGRKEADYLNKLGSEGWELVSVGAGGLSSFIVGHYERTVDLSAESVYLYFKRPISN